MSKVSLADIVWLKKYLRYTDYYIKNEFGFYVKKEW